MICITSHFETLNHPLTARGAADTLLHSHPMRMILPPITQNPPTPTAKSPTPAGARVGPSRAPAKCREAQRASLHVSGAPPTRHASHVTCSDSGSSELLWLISITYIKPYILKKREWLRGALGYPTVLTSPSVALVGRSIGSKLGSRQQMDETLLSPAQCTVRCVWRGRADVTPRGLQAEDLCTYASLLFVFFFGPRHLRSHPIALLSR